MLRHVRWISCLAVILAVSPVFAQRGGGFGGGRGMGFGGPGGGRGGSPLMLLGMPPVQEELALTADQKSKVEELVGQMREAMRPPEGMDFQSLRQLPQDEQRAKREEMGKQMQEQMAKITAEYKPKFAEVLDDVQLRRLQQINLQLQGSAALQDPEVVSALGLSQDQQDKIAAVNSDFQAKMSAGRGGPGGPGGDRGAGGDRGGPGGGMANFREAIQKRDSDVMAVLTEEQQAKLKQMKGPEFDVSQLRGGPGGNRPEGDRPQGNRPNRPARN